jgi:hypothetical protein
MPIASEPFVVPPNNILDVLPAAAGYYIEVFAAGSDGMSAGTILPIHRFVSGGSPLSLSTSTIASSEAAALAAINWDRGANNAPALIFDATTEAVARAHATDEASRSSGAYYCHYDTRNVGPSSRYLAAGGIGLTGENLAFPGSGVTTATAAFRDAESSFLSEKSAMPPGGHFVNLVDASHVWAGLAAVGVPLTDAVFSGGFYAVDYELVSPDPRSSTIASAGYPVAVTCPPGTVVNGS